MDPLEVAHLLRRTEFVARPARVTELSALATRAEAVDNILNLPPPDPIPAFIDRDIDTMGYDQYVFASQWWGDRMTDSPKPMQEKMTFFWHGHFCSSSEKVNSAQLMTEQNQLFRTMALGNFRTLAHTMSLQPAMLIYLDNIYNYASSPNQNFARELLELFTLGVGNYTENDVTAAARAWTGHGYDSATNLYVFDPTDHDTDPKTFMGVTRNFDGPDIIEFLLNENTTTKLIACKFLTRKLWRFFAYENPPATVVNQLAAVLYDNDFEMKPWVKAMLVHDEFYSTTARQGMVRNPVDFVVAVQYHTGLRGADLNPQWYYDGMGMEPWRPPNVAGWKTNGYFVNTSEFSERAEFARDVMWKLINSGSINVVTGHTPTQAADAAAALFDLQLSDASRNGLIQYATQQAAAQNWTNWWENPNLITMAMLVPEMHLA
ncbi:MAG: DUF1800 domain-containing protein [Actinomycetota bacterium]